MFFFYFFQCILNTINYFYTYQTILKYVYTFIILRENSIKYLWILIIFKFIYEYKNYYLNIYLSNNIAFTQLNKLNIEFEATALPEDKLQKLIFNIIFLICFFIVNPNKNIILYIYIYQLLTLILFIPNLKSIIYYKSYKSCYLKNNNDIWWQLL